MKTSSQKAIWNTQIVNRAIVDAFLKLEPRKMMRNPVMFVVEVGSVLTTIELIRGITAFELQITLWLWFTVLFANFAEAMAEGRGKAQADNLRKSRTETIAHRVVSDKLIQDVPAPQLRKDDLVIVSAGEFIPGETITRSSLRSCGAGTSWMSLSDTTRCAIVSVRDLRRLSA